MNKGAPLDKTNWTTLL